MIRVNFHVGPETVVESDIGRLSAWMSFGTFTEAALSVHVTNPMHAQKIGEAFLNLARMMRERYAVPIGSLAPDDDFTEPAELDPEIERLINYAEPTRLSREESFWDRSRRGLEPPEAA